MTTQASVPEENDPPAVGRRSTRNRAATQRRLLVIREEANAINDDDVANLCPKPMLPLFGETNRVPPFDEVAFISKKEFFTGPNP